MRNSSHELQLQLSDGHRIPVNTELMASKSARVSAIVNQNSPQKVAFLFREMSSLFEKETIEQVTRFCHGYASSFLCCENVIPVACLAHFLEMTEAHNKNNLLQASLVFFEQKVLPSWNEAIKALRSSHVSLHHAAPLGLIDACIDSLVNKALIFLWNSGRPNQLEFEDVNEDLVSLPLELYEAIIEQMKQRGVPLEFVASSVVTFANIWMLSTEAERRREAIEAVERMIPCERDLVSMETLCLVLRAANEFECNEECTKGFERIIGLQLDNAAVGNLLTIPCRTMQGVDSVKRILKHFYRGHVESSDSKGITTVANLMEDFLVKVAEEEGLSAAVFVALAEVSNAASLGTKDSSDGIYRAVDVYFDRHEGLGDGEKEEVCKVVDWGRLSPDACRHAAKNRRLPMRVTVQVLFASQFNLREAVVRVFDGRLGEINVERMSSRLRDLEKECLMMKREIGGGSRTRPKKSGLWSDLKRKFGCVSFDTCDGKAQIKRKEVLHP